MKSAKKSLGLKKAKKNSKPAAKRAKSAKVTKKAKAVKRVGKANLRIGIYGGGFDPFHHGHFNSLLSVRKAMKLDQVKVIPASQSPLRTPVEGSSPEHRLEMVRRATIGNEEWLTVDDREIRRGGISYTIDTINQLKKETGKADLFLIVGMDQFENFDQWKDFAEILEKVDLVVTSRPGIEIPRTVEYFPNGMKPLVTKFHKGSGVLKSGHKMQFIQLQDVDVSATEVRRALREKQSVMTLIPEPVADYIRAHGLYQNVSKTIGDFERFTRQCADWLISKGAINVQAFDLRLLNSPAEFTLIASGTSTRHASGLAEFLSREVKHQLGVWPQGLEGVNEGRWVVLDYGSLIVHVFYDYLRQEYRLEDLWSDGKALTLSSTGEKSNISPAPSPRPS